MIGTMAGVNLSEDRANVQDSSHEWIKELTRGMARGDEQCFREFYDRYSHRLLGYTLALTNGNAADAEECVQQTLIKIAAKVRPFEAEGLFWGWCAKVARNVVLDQRRQRGRYLGFLERFWRSKNEHTVPLLDENKAHMAIAETVQDLDSSEQRLLQMKYVEGLSVKEIAEAFGSTAKAVESRLSRARAELKRRALERLKHE
ncbi:MAG TPA: sigma-70 family RNA polymerase sigma factor [Methylomirabilota bacterium]|nr:sigma-70 family RNA polymerase sigma factor [Methylomirabilota bacterium]